MKLFCDSGAYSAWTNKTSIDIDKYIKFIRENKDYLETYACLDDITNPDKTWENQEIMEKAGLKPLPVFHVDENDKYLERAMTYDYFAVGGMALKGSVSRISRFNHVFSKVCTEKNNYTPTHKIHGFGLASPDLLVAYPWYSADTTSWAQYGRFGIILVPTMINGKVRYDKPPDIITVSSRSKGTGDARHFINQGKDVMQKSTIEYCEKLGCPVGETKTIWVDPDYELQKGEKWIDKKEETLPDEKKSNKKAFVRIIKNGLCCDGEMRDRINLQYFLDLEKFQKKWPWRWQESISKIDYIDPKKNLL